MLWWHVWKLRRNYPEAIGWYERALALSPRGASTYAALGFTHHLQHNLSQAIDYYHKALGLKSDDLFTAEMLTVALSEECLSYSQSGSAANDKAPEITKLKAQVEALNRGKDVASTSATVSRPVTESEEIARLRREQVEVRTAMDKRLASMEEVIFALQKQCEVVEANAEVWRIEAMRPGNKRGSIAIGQTPISEARVRTRVTPAASPGPTGRVNAQLKEMVERHQREVDLLKEMRLREVNARKESKEVEKLKKEAMVRLETGRKTGGTNLKSRLDDVVGSSAKKDKGKCVVTPVTLEGVGYTKLEEAKEAIAQSRTDRAMQEDDQDKEPDKNKSVVERTDDQGEDSVKA
ncbi:hypothetical protein CBR_g34498 [Chara braunii]|uniref:Uncharacterized protein n=1 Tax=Chara braunii TaxID=69332 RepID=A0A388LIS2_CHABU|nr:hypothetical protein CBR_g34498 [Chara braunii]|eukprot:GBG82216.1 hypothetical protein CBR_g34498 [Chara braunii]